MLFQTTMKHPKLTSTRCMNFSPGFVDVVHQYKGFNKEIDMMWLSRIYRIVLPNDLPSNLWVVTQRFKKSWDVIVFRVFYFVVASLKTWALWKKTCFSPIFGSLILLIFSICLDLSVSIPLFFFRNTWILISTLFCIVLCYVFLLLISLNWGQNVEMMDPDNFVLEPGEQVTKTLFVYKPGWGRGYETANMLKSCYMNWMWM